MDNTFNKELWKLGLDNPELREAIARSIIRESKGYYIATRQKCETTGEVEDVHTWAFTEELPVDRDSLIKAIETTDKLTVGELAKVLNCVRIALLEKEAKGERLTDNEKTLRDIDISLFTLSAMCCASETVKRESILEIEAEEPEES